MKALVLRSLRKSFRTPHLVEVLKGLDLEIEAGASVAITGKSGEGKSTLLHVIGMLEGLDSGSMELFGSSAQALSPHLFRQRHIGFIFQSFNLLEDFTVLDNLLMPARIARRKIDLARAYRLLEEVHLSHRMHFLAKLLSGGEKQRLAIARALMNDPDLILADEPSGNLDHFHSSAIHQLLVRLVKEHKKTLITATHDTSLSALCDHTYLLQEGLLQCIS